MIDLSLYPFKFAPIYKNKIWGGNKINQLLGKSDAPLTHCGESWEISALPDDFSQVINGFLSENTLDELIEVYMGDLVGEHVFENFGTNFPLLIKFIDAGENLSVQVHPDEKGAAQIQNAHAKTELWYVMDADPGAGLYVGFQEGVEKSLYLNKLEEGRIDELLRFFPVKPGDVFFIPGGTVHAIGKGVLLAEIQQSSDTTFRIFDWNRSDQNGQLRPLHTDEAIKVLNFDEQPSPKIDYKQYEEGTNALVRSNYFNINFLHYHKPIEKIFVDIDSFIIYICVNGSALLVMDGQEKVNVQKGEILLLPASCTEMLLIPEVAVSFLEVYLP
jgi:mannose-6-phosphate isomerase